MNRTYELRIKVYDRFDTLRFLSECGKDWGYYVTSPSFVYGIRHEENFHVLTMQSDNLLDLTKRADELNYNGYVNSGNKRPAKGSK